jgi:hypothetical protein
MSLWTPSGEHPVGEGGGTHGGSPPRQGHGGGGRDPRPDATGGAGPDEAGGAGPEEADVDELRRRLADAPADVVIANHCYGLFELAAVYLSGQPPRLDAARLAIDALGVLVDGLGDRLGEAHASLRDALAQLRLAYVQIASVADQADGAAGGAGSDGDGGGGSTGATAAGGSPTEAPPRPAAGDG